MQETSFRLKNFVFITIGALIFAFGFVNFNLPNNIASGGLAGLTMIFRALFGINPTYAGYAINLPLVMIGAYLFGKRSMVYSLYGIFSMYAFVWLFQLMPLGIDLQQDNLVVALFAGIVGGLGGGIVLRYGGTIGGSDIIVKVMEDKLGIPINQGFLLIDITVMIASLTYINMNQMMYALIASFMYSQAVKIVQIGGYSVRGMMIISDQAPLISQHIMEKLGRGVTYLKGEGAYSGKEKNVMYVAMSPQDVREAKNMIQVLDPQAFVSVFSIEEVTSPEFIASRSKYRKQIR